jgi:Domain of unknown function (DUF5916)/Carbohydrate family 9 binding domain-like
MLKLLSWILTVYLLTGLTAFAQQSNPNAVANGGEPIVIDYEAARLSRVATAVRVTEKITLDGTLQEPDWKLVAPATGFVQYRPNTGEPAQEQTEARFLYDEDNLYVGIICFDSDAAHMVVNGLKEDYQWNETDTVGVIIDSLHDRRSGFYFQANPAGARRDQQISNDSQASQDWDGVWDVKVTRNNEGWIAEFMIPFKTLRFSSSPTQEWGLNLSRRLLRLNEESHWSPIPVRYNTNRMSQAGVLRGLENIDQGRNLKVKPFVTGGITQVRPADGSMQTVQTLTRLKDYDGGVDLKYSLRPSLTLDATYHTDFAQVEVDQQQVNLTRFNLFFPEKRDFFLENSNTFNVGPGINQFGFNSNGNLIPFFSRRIGLSASGTPIPIIGGARVSGKVNQYDVGLLAMKTERSGSTPSNDFLVGRLKRNLFRNSWVGTLVTDRSSNLPSDYNRVYGTDGHFEFDRLQFDSYILRSDTPGRSGRNQARRFQTGWIDDELTVSAEYNSVQPNFNPEVGFVRRKEVTQYSGDFAWKPMVMRSEAIRNLNFGTNLDYYGGSRTGKVETRTQEANAGIQFENNGWVTFVVNQTFDRLVNDLQIPSGNPHVLIPTGDYHYLGYSARFNTSPSWKIGGNGNFNWGEFYNGHRKSFNGGLNLKLNLHATINLNYDRNQVQLPDGSFTTSLVGTRMTYAFSPRAFIDAFIQYNADTHQVSSNIRFDFTHHPLSDLYLVYNDTRDTITGQIRERAFIFKFTNLFSF